MANYSVYDIANWFLSKGEGNISPKKIQKLLYYAYSWTLAFYNEDEDKLENKLFDDEIEAWVHGPVIRSIYNKYAPWGYHDITEYENVGNIFSTEIEDTLLEVWESYGPFSGNELESLTHSEDPWIEAREGLKPLDSTDKKINDKTIFNYYTKKMVV